MRMSSFRVQNYKSFRDSGQLDFSGGFNVVVGENNVGKTALLEALSLAAPAKPHKSPATAPRYGTPVNQITQIEVRFVLSGAEARDLLLENGAGFSLPIPAHGAGNVAAFANAFCDELFGLSEIEFFIKLETRVGQAVIISPSRYPSFGRYSAKPLAHPNAQREYLRMQVDPSRTRFVHVSGVHNHDAEEIGCVLTKLIEKRIYVFRAERLGVDSSPFGLNEILTPDAANLPEVLNQLQSRNPARFKRFNEFVHRVFPSIWWVSVRPKVGAQNALELGIWLDDPTTEREDLVIPLSEGGTGVGQVLAILYVVLNANYSRTIVIDEPNSFLHPGATRKLIEIMRQFPMHQYIISTHSPEVLAATNLSTLSLLTWNGGETKIERLDALQIGDLERTLSAVGARLSDVFGAEKILWVEGQTEERCFRLIVEKLLRVPLTDTEILAVKDTGDLESKKPSAKLIWEIYERLSKGRTLLPRAVAFEFDREGRADNQIRDLEKRSKGMVHFLPRRTYENYLIHGRALSAVLMQELEDEAQGCSEVEIVAWLENAGGDSKYYKGECSTGFLRDSEWLSDVNGARLLAGLFLSQSGGKVEYRKIIHSVALTEWLIENDPNALSGLAKFIDGLVSGE